jgi:hypothetical protein
MIGESTPVHLDKMRVPRHDSGYFAPDDVLHYDTFWNRKIQAPGVSLQYLCLKPGPGLEEGDEDREVGEAS